jgi:hypothetical protein
LVPAKRRKEKEKKKGRGKEKGQSTRQTISVRVLVNESNGIIKGVNIQTNKNRSKDFLCVARHLWSNSGKDGGSEEVTLLETRNSNPTSIKKELSALINSRLNEILSTLLGLKFGRMNNV